MPPNFEALLKPGGSKQGRSRYSNNSNGNFEEGFAMEETRRQEISAKAELFKGNASVIFEENEEFTKKTTIALTEDKPALQIEIPQASENDEFVTFNKLSSKKMISQFIELNESEEEASRLKAKVKNLEKELEGVVLELKQVKMEWALTEERKEETEVQLKNEIKYLLNKLLQAQNMKNDDHSRNLSLNVSGIKDTLKESIISRTSRSRSPSIYKPPSAIKQQRGYLTVREEATKNEELEDFGEEHARMCGNASFLTVKTMKDLNKAN